MFTSILNTLTKPLANHLAFESVSYPLTSLIEYYKEETHRQLLLFGKLRVIIN
jgi:hypothetical protein